MNRKFQQGAAILVITVLLLMGITLISIYATKVGILDQKISANEYRHKEAFANAEAALDQAAAFLSANPTLHRGDAGWESCSAGDGFPCNLTGIIDVYGTIASGAVSTGVANIAALTNSSSYLIRTANNTTAIGEGQSADGTGRATAQISYVTSSLIDVGELPPIMLPTGSLSGNFNIVPNPNGGGEGVPVSVWSKQTLDTSGANWKTCHHGEFKHNGIACLDSKGDGDSGDSWLACSCDGEISNSGNVDTDLILNTADFPDSPFAYLFDSGDLSTTAAEVLILKEEIKSRAERTGLVLEDCDDIVADFAGLTRSALVWVTGDCIIGGENVGSRDKPIILVVENLLRVNANSEVWGILFSFDDFVLNGGPVIHGSAISEVESDLTNGTYAQVYDEDLLASLTDDSINIELTKKKFSWRDF